MQLYNRYADILLELHREYHDLVLKEFDDLGTFNPMEYGNGLNDNIKKNIEYKPYPSLWDSNKVIVRPILRMYKSSKYGYFCIEYRSYSGKVAKKIYNKTVSQIQKIKDKNRDNQQVMEKKLMNMKMNNDEFWGYKHALFDFYLSTGNRYSTLYKGDATHKNLLKDLQKYTNYENCLRIWKGDYLFNELDSGDERDVLFTLSMLMFEQEVNYGDSPLQQYTNFRSKNNHRPRDMIMGFVNMLFSDRDTFNEYPYWNGEYPDFGQYEGIGYANLDDRYKKYFTEFKNPAKYGEVLSLMDVNNNRECFNSFHKEADRNPRFDGLTI